jgi:hypothetical protein
MESRINILLSCLGIDSKSFLNFLEWALAEQLVATISTKNTESIKQYYIEVDGLKRFRDDLRKMTGKNWSTHDLNLLFDAVKRKTEKHYREPIAYGEYLKLLWTTPHRCTKCGKEPPEVTLHIDHIVPASLGGASKRHNIQRPVGSGLFS